MSINKIVSKSIKQVDIVKKHDSILEKVFRYQVGVNACLIK